MGSKRTGAPPPWPLGVGVVTFAVSAVLRFAALVSPLTSVLVRRRVPSPLSAQVGRVPLVLGVPVGVGFLLVSRAFDQFGLLKAAVTRAIDDLRRDFVDEPLALQPERATSCALALEARSWRSPWSR